MLSGRNVGLANLLQLHATMSGEEAIQWDEDATMSSEEDIQWDEDVLREAIFTPPSCSTQKQLALELLHTILHPSQNVGIKRQSFGLEPPTIDRDRLKQLLDHGADPNYFNDLHDNYKIPLYHLVVVCDLDSIRLLVEHGADLAVRWDVELGMTRTNLLGLACECRKRLEIARFLAISGAPLPDADYEYEAVFHNIIAMGDVRLLEILRSRDSKFDNYITSPPSSLRSAHTQEMRLFLVENGVYLDSDYIRHMIQHMRDYATLKAIFTKRLDVNSYRRQCSWSKKYQRSMLYGAICEKRLEVASVFLECGANPNDGYPLFRIMRMFTRGGAHYEPYYTALINRMGQLDATFILVDDGGHSLYNHCPHIMVYSALLQNGAVMTRRDTLTKGVRKWLEDNNDRDIATRKSFDVICCVIYDISQSYAVFLRTLRRFVAARRMREWLKTGDVYHALCYLANRWLYPPYVRCVVPKLDIRVGLDQEQDPFLFVPDDVDTMVNESWIIQPPKMVMRKARDPYDTHPQILTDWLLVR